MKLRSVATDYLSPALLGSASLCLLVESPACAPSLWSVACANSLGLLLDSISLGITSVSCHALHELASASRVGPDLSLEFWLESGS